MPVSNRNIPEAFALANRLIARELDNSLSHFAKSGAGPQRDVTATLLTPWSYEGEGNARRAIELVDRLRDENFAVFRDYHAGLIAMIANNPPEAARRMKSAYETDKNTLRLVDAYARFVARSGRRDEALGVYQAFDELDFADFCPLVSDAGPKD